MLLTSCEKDTINLYRGLKSKGFILNPFFDFAYNEHTEQPKIIIPKKEDEEEAINEESMRQLRRDADKARKERAKKIEVHYMGVLKDKGWIKFATPSQSRKGKIHYQYIKLLDVKDIGAVRDLNPKDIVNLMLSGNVAVYCSCEDFLYKGFKYLGYNTGYGIYREMRFPKVRNPNLEGTMCKHLISVADVLLMHYMRIYKDLIKSPYWNSIYDNDIKDIKIKK